MSLIYIILSVISWMELIISFIIFMPVQALLFVVTLPFDKHKKIMHYNSSILCLAVLTMCPLISLQYEGRKNIDRSKPNVIVMNHQSILDLYDIIPVIWSNKHSHYGNISTFKSYRFFLMKSYIELN